MHHILTHDKKLSYGCIVCSKIFWNHVSLHYHYRQAHYQLKPYLCLFCGFFSRDMAQLHRHLLSHNVEGIKKAICEQCGKCFSNSSGLKAHVEQVHSEVMQYECKICHHKFKSKYRYRWDCIQTFDQNGPLYSLINRILKNRLKYSLLWHFWLASLVLTFLT